MSTLQRYSLHPKHTMLHLFALCHLAVFSACTGHVPDNAPGNDTYLGYGALAVDHRTEKVYLVQDLSTTDEGSGEITSKLLLYSVDPDAGVATMLEDLSGLSDLRMLFPDDSILLMQEQSHEVDGGTVSQDRISKRDPITFEELDALETEARYHGTRMSSSRRFVAVADNNDMNIPIHVIDSHTLSVTEVPHGGDNLEVMWLHKSDRLMAISFDYDYALNQDGQSVLVDYNARIMSWSLDGQAEDASAESIASALEQPTLSIDLPQVAMDYFFSYTWVGVSPDDHFVVFPVLHDVETETETLLTNQLIILDTTDGSIRDFEGGLGPVGFTPDGSTIVSYKYDLETLEDGTTVGKYSLLLIDALTLAYETLELPDSSGPVFFVTREDNFVVIDNTGDGQLWLYDVDQQQVNTVDAPQVDLYEFVSRLGHDELWMVSEGLYRLDFVTAELEAIPLDFTPSHINVLPKRDLLVMDDLPNQKVKFYDPNSRTVVKEVQLLHEYTLPAYLGM